MVVKIIMIRGILGNRQIKETESGVFLLANSLGDKIMNHFGADLMGAGHVKLQHFSHLFKLEVIILHIQAKNEISATNGSSMVSI